MGVIQLLYIIGQHRKKISQQTKMPSRMTSHNRITKRQKKLIDLFGPENLKKDRVIEKKFAILFGDCRNKERTFLRDIRIKRKYRLLFGENQDHNNSVKNSRISKNRKKCIYLVRNEILINNVCVHITWFQDKNNEMCI